jgi:hypothetical protein
MEKNFKITNGDKVSSQEVLKIISERRERSNKDLEVAMKFIKADFDHTKDQLLKMTDHLDKLEITYNTVLKEYNSRKGVSGTR